MVSAIRIHIDIGPICWQFVSMVQPNVEHDGEGEAEVIEIESSSSIGFSRNPDSDEE